MRTSPSVNAGPKFGTLHTVRLVRSGRAPIAAMGPPLASGQDLVAVDAQDIDCMAEGTAFGRDWASKSSLAQKIRRRLGQANFSIQTSSRGAHCYAPART